MNGETMVQAARRALSTGLERDPSVLVLGEDVVSGGPFGLTKTLCELYGARRVRNTPISEGSFMGVGIGLAIAGARPFVDIMFNDFLTLASDQLFNHAAKIHFMSGGRRSVPLTVWTVAGAGTRWGAQHSQHLDGWLAQVPGLKVLSPASPEMMASSITAALEDPDPVVLIVDRSLLYSRDPLPGDGCSPWEPRVIREGRDVTVVASGRLVHLALKVALEVAPSVEVVDLQRLAPLSVDRICSSLEKTSRLVLLHDEAATGAMVPMLAAQIYDQAYWLLDGPIIRVSSPATPVPAAPQLEDEYLVNAIDVRKAIDRAISR